MLNLVTFDIDDQPLLENSFNAIKNKAHLTIVDDQLEKERLFNLVLGAASIPSNCHFSFQNVFKIVLQSKTFYVAQFLIDFGFPQGARGVQTFIHKYHYGALGLASLTVNLGKTNLRPQVKFDKFFDRLFKGDIDIKDAQRFNDKYYLTSTNEKAVNQFFEKDFVELLSKHDDLLISINQNQMFVSFANELRVMHCRIIEQIFESLKVVAL